MLGQSLFKKKALVTKERARNHKHSVNFKGKLITKDFGQKWGEGFGGGARVNLQLVKRKKTGK